jgi:RNA polymerase sigma-70 factor (ECF subfamily)
MRGEGDRVASVGEGVADKVARADTPGACPEDDRDVLLRSARRGDPEAFMSLMAPERARLQSLAYRLLDDSGEVPDVLQEVYLAAYRALPGYRGDSSLATWLYRITYNACLAQRARRPELAEAQDEAGPSEADHAEAAVTRLDLAKALSRLPLEQRALVLMVDRDGFDYRAAAEALSIPIGTVSSRLAAARAKLREALASDAKGGDG